MIFLTGPHGAGKTTVAQMMSDYNFDYIDLGVFLRQYYQTRRPEISFQDWCAQNEKRHGQFFTDALIVSEIIRRCKKALSQSPIPQDLVVVGSRSWRGVNYITERVPRFNGHNHTVVYIDAPFKTLKRRYCAREKRSLTVIEFQVILDYDNQMGLIDLISNADVRIKNNGSRKTLRVRAEKIIFNNLGYSRR